MTVATLHAPDVLHALRALGQVQRLEADLALVLRGDHCPGCTITLLGEQLRELEDTRQAWERMPAARAELAAKQATRRTAWNAAAARLAAAASGQHVPEYAPIRVEPW